MTVLITGAANGLGKALADQAMTDNHRVIGLDHQWQDKSPSVAPSVAIDIDLSDIRAINTLLPVLATHAPFSTVIHNAAISATGAFEDIPAKVHQRLIDVNVISPMILTQRLLEQNALVSGSTLVFIASLSVQTGYPGAVSYAASKAALANYAKSLRKALRGENINVLTVYPGPIKTGQAERHAPLGARPENRMEPVETAALIWEAIGKRRKTLIPGSTNKFFALAGRVAPSMLNKIMKKILYDKLDRPVY